MVPEISSDETATLPSYLFKEWESSWEGKKPSHMQTELVVDSSSLVYTVLYVQNLTENLK